MDQVIELDAHRDAFVSGTRGFIGRIWIVIHDAEFGLHARATVNGQAGWIAQVVVTFVAVRAIYHCAPRRRFCIRHTKVKHGIVSRITHDERYLAIGRERNLLLFTI
jgi:hypothetical protein